MIQIAHNPFYQLRVDQVKNRILLKIDGIWACKGQVPYYLEHLKQALALVETGFSILTDIRELEGYSPSVRAIHLEAQKMTVAAGIYQLAEVHELQKPGSQLAIKLAKESAIPLNIFDSLEDAEAWLEDITQVKEQYSTS